MSFCENCVKGVTHEGEAKGKWEEINGVNCYIATPTTDYPKDKVLLFLTDVFGPQLINNQLLADDFAANGFKTIIPDYLNGDPIPADALNPGGSFDIMKWFPSHGTEQTRPPLDKVIEGLKKDGITAFGATGYCFGGRYCFDLGFDGIPKAIAVAHPSLLKVPDDLEKYTTTATAPILFNTCTVDSQFPLTASSAADEIFGNGKFKPGYKREYFEGCEHGFAVRGDMSNPKVKAGKEGAFKATVEWMIKYL